MALLGWWCTTCLKEVPFGHFLKDCPAPPMPREWEGVLLDALEADRANEGHNGLNISATSLLTCARQTFIDRLWDRHVDPASFFSAEAGAVFHDRLARAAIKYGLALPEVPLGPVWLVGLSERVGPIHMTPDVVRATELDDYKFTNPTSLRYLPSDGHPSPEHEAQWSLYWHAKHQQDGVERSGIVWYASMLTGRESAQLGGPWLRREAGVLSVEQVAELHPHGCEATCAEIGMELRGAFTHVEAGVPKEDILALMPLHGLSMMVDKRTGQSNKCLKACSVRDICMAYGGGSEVKHGKRKKTEADATADEQLDDVFGVDLSDIGGGE